MKKESIEIKAIALDKIAEAPWNTRAGITNESVRTLAESIKADGLLQPLNVIADVQSGTEAYICFDGCRRLNALHAIGAKDAPCRVWSIAESEAKVMTVTANIQREDDDPLHAAKVIGELLDAGEKPEQIASKLGKTTPWVRRRAKLCAMPKDVAERVAGKVTLDAMEKIAVMPPRAQASIAKAAESRARSAGGRLVTAADLKWDIQHEQQSIDDAEFDTKPCRRCANRTGAQQDLWGEPDGKLGSCNDIECFRRRMKAHEDALIAKATLGAKDVEVCNGAWCVPSEADADKPTKRKPCAYVYFEGGKAVAKYGPSRADIEAERDRAEKEREAERAEKCAERERESRIKERFTDTASSEERDGDVRELIRDALKNSEKARDYAVGLIADIWADMWDREEVANVLAAFGGAAKLCGISDEDAEWFIERNAPEDDGDGE